NRSRSADFGYGYRRCAPVWSARTQVRALNRERQQALPHSRHPPVEGADLTAEGIGTFIEGSESFNGVIESFNGVIEGFNGVIESFNGVIESFNGVIETCIQAIESFIEAIDVLRRGLLTGKIGIEWMSSRIVPSLWHPKRSNVREPVPPVLVERRASARRPRPRSTCPSLRRHAGALDRTKISDRAVGTDEYYSSTDEYFSFTAEYFSST